MKRIFRDPGGILVLSVLLSLGFMESSPRSVAQVLRGPASFSEVSHLLRNYVSPHEVANYAIRFRISFQVTPDVSAELTKMGADGELLKTLKEVAPSPDVAPDISTPMIHSVAAAVSFAPSAGVALIVSSALGGVEVYVDDVRQGKTNSDGLLKVPDLTPGQRKLRISRDGYEDFESVVDVKPGGTTTQVIPALVSVGSHATAGLPPGAPVAMSEPVSANPAPGMAFTKGKPATLPPLTGEPVFVKDAFHIVGIPALRRNKKFDLSITTKEMVFMEDGRRVYEIPFEHIQRVQMNLEKRDYAKTTYVAVLALGAPGALVLAYKRTVDALVINYKNERGGIMEMVIQVSKGMGTPCLARLALGGIAVGPPEQAEVEP
jgi:hypothetical protein